MGERIINPLLNVQKYKSYKKMMIINPYRFSNFQLPLDEVTGAYHAYSLRKLRAAYSGFAVRVRRSSDNIQQDIGFNVLGEFDTTAYSAFVGAGTGYVVTIYDQTGNGIHLTTSVGGNQAQILLSTLGTNLKPCIYFTGTSWYLLPFNYLSGENAVSYSFTQKHLNGNNSNSCLIGSAYDYGYGVELSNLYGGNFSFNIRNSGNAFLFTTGWHQGTTTVCSMGVNNTPGSEIGERAVLGSAPVNMGKQSAVQAVNYPPAAAVGNVAFGRYYSGGYNYTGYIGDFICYKKLFTRPEIQGLNANQNRFYGIYP